VVPVTKKRDLYNYEFGEFHNGKGQVQRISYNKDTGRIVASGGIFDDRYMGRRFVMVQGEMHQAGWKWVKKGGW
jgi:hypothetical protein